MLGTSLQVQVRITTFTVTVSSLHEYLHEISQLIATAAILQCLDNHIFLF